MVIAVVLSLWTSSRKQNNKGAVFSSYKKLRYRKIRKTVIFAKRFSRRKSDKNQVE